MQPLIIVAVVSVPQDGLNFIQMMTDCIPVAVQLLGSKVISDILESLEFLSTAFEFQVRGSQEGVRKALALVWSREQQVKDAVVTAYVRLYLNQQVRLQPFNHAKCLVVCILGKQLLTVHLLMSVVDPSKAHDKIQTPENFWSNSICIRAFLRLSTYSFCAEPAFAMATQCMVRYNQYF